MRNRILDPELACETAAAACGEAGRDPARFAARGSPHTSVAIHSTRPKVAMATPTRVRTASRTAA
ncbi:hypothetical protein EHYA_03559 [Embleya hyalina]|uniref:Uncharacterized protein n=1 Tax=Embleya hyalina TaxID=516124 RepID=A0A401YMQ0_9ACTN|nr:hypothetical protein EHYA_03559 [Embleya hyalina]